jgi:beta-galactosidase
MGINCDVTGIDSDLSAYRLVILPAYNIVSGEDVMKLEDYVENGGHVAITFRSGNRDGSNRINGLPLPGLFSKMCGIRVVDYDAAGKSIRKVATTSGVVDAYTWCDVIEEDTAVPTARYLDGFYKGSTAASSNAFGKGMVHYIGFGTDGTSYMKLLDGIAASALVDRPPVKNVPGAEIVERADGDDRFFFVLNHNSHQVMLRLDGLFKDVLSGKQAREVLELEAFDVAVLYLIREDGEI